MAAPATGESVLAHFDTILAAVVPELTGGSGRWRSTRAPAP
ncbi:hypothetical protein [Streptomyces sp. NBC_01237]|nr:hypothetical protein [Streptomyces sp. NBC_01237]WRZ70177.1 hypothetical protein OG251_00110 [Streptomyces sp. NBC_01237]